MDEKERETQITVQIFGLITFVWVMIGLVAFLWSIYCFGKAGTIFQKFVGNSPTYCK